MDGLVCAACDKTGDESLMKDCGCRDGYPTVMICEHFDEDLHEEYHNLLKERLLCEDCIKNSDPEQAGPCGCVGVDNCVKCVHYPEALHQIFHRGRTTNWYLCENCDSFDMPVRFQICNCDVGVAWCDCCPQNFRDYTHDFIPRGVGEETAPGTAVPPDQT